MVRDRAAAQAVCGCVRCADGDVRRAGGRRTFGGGGRGNRTLAVSVKNGKTGAPALRQNTSGVCLGLELNATV